MEHCSLLATLVLLASLTVPAQAHGAWTATGPLVYGRWLTTTARLADGRVLVAGGIVNGFSTEAGTFASAANSWAATGNMTTARRSHTATLLNDGRVLVVSGSTVKIFDPATGT